MVHKSVHKYKPLLAPNPTPLVTPKNPYAQPQTLTRRPPSQTPNPPTRYLTGLCRPTLHRPPPLTKIPNHTTHVTTQHPTHSTTPSTSTPNMSTTLRARRPRPLTFPAGPPVPPKPARAATLPAQRQMKALPHIPQDDYHESSETKALPPPPTSEEERLHLKITTTLLWILGFTVWFVLIVLLLPVVLERDVLVRTRGLLRVRG